MQTDTFKKILIFISLMAGISMSFIALLTPPPGEISGSVLLMCGEIMIFILGMLGVGDIAVKFLGQINDKINELKNITDNKSNGN